MCGHEKSMWTGDSIDRNRLPREFRVLGPYYIGDGFGSISLPERVEFAR